MKLLYQKKNELNCKPPTPNKQEDKCIIKWPKKSKKKKDRRTLKNTKNLNSPKCSKKMVKFDNAIKDALLISSENMRMQITLSSNSKYPNIYKLHSSL